MEFGENQNNRHLNKILPIQKILILFFVAIFGILLILSAVSYRNGKTFKNSSFWIKHTQVILSQTAFHASLLKNLQFLNSEYLFTSDTANLNLYYNYKVRINKSLNFLQELTIDNNGQRLRIDSLTMLTNKLTSFLDNTIAQKKGQRLLDETIAGFFQERERLNAYIDRLIEEIRNEESALLMVREAANERSINIANTYFIIALGGIFVLLVVSFSSINYHFKKRIKAEEGLKKSEEKFLLLVNNIKDYAICLLDKNGHIVNWYEGAAQVKGYTNEEVMGKHISVFYTPEDMNRGEPEYNLKMAAEKGKYETEGWRIRKDGTRFWANVIITAIYNDNGEVKGFTKIVRDYSLHKKAEDEIRKALEKERELNELKSNFVSMASHEFRTPLSTILSSVSLLEQYTTTEQQEKRERHIKRIKSSITELTSILEEFLSLEKIEEGKIDVQKKHINIKELALKLCTEMSEITKPGQKIECHHEGNEIIVSDPVFIRHIMSNFISNSIKYSPANSKIIVYTGVGEDKITLGVIDNGMGISEEDQKYLFQRFFRAKNVTGIQGTGLGLHIVKRYVDMLRGRIQVKSELNVGTEFVVEFNRYQ